jgi:oligoribonuclease NrnB/cAMP/cGMP phosphodiesterase (DHH superfamily)
MRLITRGDLDGLACAVLITEMEQVDSIELIHPQDLTDKKFEIKEGDILANVPYHPKAAKWFDHHELTESNEKPPATFEGEHRKSPSTARIVFEFYNSPRLERYEKMLYETDRLDSAHLAMEDVTDPQDYILLGYTIDPRTGLGSFKEYFLLLMEALKTKDIREILQMPEVKQRVDRMKSEWQEFRRHTIQNSRVEGNVIITDFRGVDPLPIGNRFLVYTLFPDANASIRVHWGPQKQFVAVTVGHSIFNRTSRVNVGELMSEFGGGGHFGAGATPLKPETADKDIAEMIKRLNA